MKVYLTTKSKKFILELSYMEYMLLVVLRMWQQHCHIQAQMKI